MVQLTEVLDEEFVREQEGPHDEDDWDTDSGTPLPNQETLYSEDSNILITPQSPTPHPSAPPPPTTNPSTSASSPCKT